MRFHQFRCVLIKCFNVVLIILRRGGIFIPGTRWRHQQEGYIPVNSIKEIIFPVNFSIMASLHPLQCIPVMILVLLVSSWLLPSAQGFIVLIVVIRLHCFHCYHQSANAHVDVEHHSDFAANPGWLSQSYVFLWNELLHPLLAFLDMTNKHLVWQNVVVYANPFSLLLTWKLSFCCFGDKWFLLLLMLLRRDT